MPDFFVKPVQHSRLQAGFGLTEVMVGMVIGLITILVILQTYALFEGQKRTTGTNADIQLASSEAVLMIERDIRNAGYGFALAGAMSCTVRASFDGNPFTFNLVPVTIVQGSGTQADTIQIMYSNNDALSIPTRITFDHPETAINFCVDTTQGINEDNNNNGVIDPSEIDMMIAYEPGKDCVLLQATSVGDDGSGNGQGCTQTQVKHQNSDWNPTGAAAADLYPDAGYSKDNGAVLFNVGQFVNKTYSVTAMSASSVGANLHLNEWDTAASSTSGGGAPTRQFDLVSGVINLQAQYGKDTNGDGAVDTWDETTPSDSTGWQQVLAVRFAVAVRSPLYEKTAVTASGVAAWAGGSIDLRLKPDGTQLADWDHYRYHVQQAVTPIRNAIWRQ